MDKNWYLILPVDVAFRRRNAISSLPPVRQVAPCVPFESERSWRAFRWLRSPPRLPGLANGARAGGGGGNSFWNFSLVREMTGGRWEGDARPPTASYPFKWKPKLRWWFGRSALRTQPGDYNLPRSTVATGTRRWLRCPPERTRIPGAGQNGVERVCEVVWRTVAAAVWYYEGDCLFR